METRQPSVEFDVAREECVRKLSGDLDFSGVYHHLDSGLGYISPELTEYFQERGEQISAGEDVWMARNMASPQTRVFDFFSGGEMAGSLAVNFKTDQLLALSVHGDVMYSDNNLVEAVDSIESQLVGSF